jgi:hypothetical protein
MHLLCDRAMHFANSPSTTMEATLTGFEPEGAVSRSCAFHAQNCAMLHLRGESSDECFGGIAQIYAVLVSEFVRNASRARAYDSGDARAI